jgi:hypothetical protein
VHYVSTAGKEMSVVLLGMLVSSALFVQGSNGELLGELGKESLP